MIIGINAAAAIKQPRTGVEEYVYQLIKHLTMLPEAREHRFFLYAPSIKNKKCHAEFISASHGIPKQVRDDKKENLFDFPLPPNFIIKELKWPLPFLWTQMRLAWELRWHKPDALFIPAHVLPFVSSENSVVAVHGLEYEYFPEHYLFWRRWYLRWSTKSAVRRARKIIAVSENTKNDLVKLYRVKAEKIEVVHHGISFSHSDPAEAGEESRPNGRSGIRQRSLATLGMTAVAKPYILYLGRLETKKNVQGILEAYKILKKEYGVPHELVLAGGRGYGYEKIKEKIDNFNDYHAEFISAPHGIPKQVRDDKIIEPGYVDNDTKWQLLSGADIFIFPSFYEGFGLPILEAQSAGVPVVTSANSCLPEIAGEGALFVNPKNPAQIAEAIKLIIDDSDLRDKLRQSGFENLKRFSWAKCAKETLGVVARP